MRVHSTLDHLSSPARPRGAPKTDLQRVPRKHPQPYKAENATSPRFRTRSLDVSPSPAPPATASPPPFPRIGLNLRPQELLSWMRAAVSCSPSCARARWQRSFCSCCCRSSGLEPPSQRADLSSLPVLHQRRRRHAAKCCAVLDECCGGTAQVDLQQLLEAGGGCRPRLVLERLGLAEEPRRELRRSCHGVAARGPPRGRGGVYQESLTRVLSGAGHDL